MTVRPVLNEDGSLHINEHGQQCFVADGHAVITGAATGGVVTLADGTRYDVTPLVIEAATPAHARELVTLMEEGTL